MELLDLKFYLNIPAGFHITGLSKPAQISRNRSPFSHTKSVAHANHNGEKFKQKRDENKISLLEDVELWFFFCQIINAQ